MAVYRNIKISYWQTSFVLKLTPEEKFFYMYLFTNSKTSQCGVYGLPIRVIEFETGYNNETVIKLLNRFIEYKKIEYDFENEEIYIKNWLKHNPIDSNNVFKCVENELSSIKCQKFEKIIKDYLGACKTLDGGFVDPMKKKEKEKEKKESKEETKEETKEKEKFAEFVEMTKAENEKLIQDYGKEVVNESIDLLNNYKGSSGTKYKSDYHAMKNWVIKEVQKRLNNKSSSPPHWQKSGMQTLQELAEKYKKEEIAGNEYNGDVIDIGGSG